MRFILKTVLTLLALAVLAIGAVTFLVPTDAVRDRAIAMVEEQTGRQLEVRGDTSFTFFPAIGVALEDVTLSNPPSMDGGPMLRMDSLAVDLKLMPLLSRSVEVDRFVLVRPIFDLRVDGDGNRNWDFAKPRAALDAERGEHRDTAAAAQPGKPRAMLAQASGLGGGLVQNIRLGAMRIEDGKIVYANAIDGATHRIDALNVSLRQEELSAPMSLEGDLVWRGEKVDFKGEAGTPAALLRGGASAIDVSVESAPAKAGFKGRIAAGDALTAAGDVTAETPSARGLADWAGSPLPPGKGFGPASFSGTLDYDGAVIAFSDAGFSLDGMNGRGNGSVSLKGAKPYIRAALALDKLDLNAWVGEAGAAPRTEPRPAPEPAPAPEPRAEQPPPPAADSGPRQGQSLTDFIEELNKQPSRPEVRAWSRRALNLAMLNAFDADINMNAGALYFDRLKVGASAVAASLEGGVMTANLNKLELYGGAGSGRVTLNAARQVPAMAVNFDLKGMSAHPFLIDWVDFKWISGRADMVVSVSGSGHTQQQIVNSLQGNGSVEFRDGAIEGVNIPAMVRGLKEGRFGGWRSDAREKTDFSALTGTYTVQNGIVGNSDLEMVGPLLRVTGAGTVNLPNETLDYSLTPRLVATLQGQGGEQAEGGIVIPVRVQGPLDRPKVAPDLKKLMEDPDLTKDAIDTVGKAVENMKGKKITGEQVEQLLQGVLGGGQGEQGQEGGEQQGEQPRAQDLLNQFLKKKQ